MNVSLISKAAPAIEPIKKSGPCILVFKTNIKSKKDLQKIEPVLNGNPFITSWNIDKNDIDKVLRIVTTGIDSYELVNIIKREGYMCEELPD